jgi:hypothetical protein
MSQAKLNGSVDRSLERAVGEHKRSIDERVVPDPELVERARRRRFTAEYKLRIMRETTRARRRVRSVRCCAGRACIPRI